MDRPLVPNLFWFGDNPLIGYYCLVMTLPFQSFFKYLFPMSNCKDCGRRPKAAHQSRCNPCLRDYRLTQKEAKVKFELPKAQGERGLTSDETQNAVAIRALWGIDPARSSKVKSPTKIIIDPEESILDSIRKKHQSHYVLSVNPNGRAVLQIHARPAKLVYKGDSIEEVLQSALC